MNRYQLALIALAAVNLASCKKDKDDDDDDHDHDHTASIQMQFDFVHGADAFDMNGTYADGVGHAVRFSTLKFYASDFELMDDAHVTVASYMNKAVLADASASAAQEIGTMGHGHIHEVHFSLGLNSTLNHADPTTAAYPLNIPGMHWGWNPAAGYKFLNMEGHVDGNGDGDLDDPEDVAFTYHCATDALLREAHLHIHRDVDGGTVVLTAKVDVAVLLSGLDLLTNSTAMGGGANNVTAMDSLVSAIAE
ncbi:MAG: hypothetical protein IPM46_09175 [Flavobacteriales bacterium]|nr:hypothetical protein [Flavobacteriales bacterium]